MQASYFGPGVCLGDGQTEAYLRDRVMAGPASAWAMARRRPREYRRNVANSSVWDVEAMFLQDCVG